MPLAMKKSTKTTTTTTATASSQGGSVSSKKSKIVKYSDSEIAIVKTIISTNEDSLTLNRRQLDIAMWLEKEENKINKTRSAKASFSMTGSWDKAYWLELQQTYLQPDGEVYTLQAFQHAIDYWFFKHINIGNSMCRSAGNLKYGGKNGDKVIGVNMAENFWEQDFLGGFLNHEEGRTQLEVGEDAMRSKRKTTKNTSKTNKTKEGRERNVEDAIAEMDDEAEMLALMAKLQLKLKAKKSSDDEASSEEELGSGSEEEEQQSGSEEEVSGSEEEVGSGEEE